MLAVGESDDTESPAPKVVAALAGVLDRLVSRNDRLAEPPSAAASRLSVFRGSRAPAIGVEKYLERIHRYSGCSPACFVVGYVYIDRLLHRHPEALLGPLNVHRLLLSSIMVASKVLDDVHYDNAFYAKVGGVNNAELNKMELELLFLLDFGVMVSSRVFESYCLHLEKEMLCDTAGRRIQRVAVSPLAGGETELEMPTGDGLLSLSLPPQAVN